MSQAYAAQADEVALCVGCTSDSQFEAAAKQAVGTMFNGERVVLAVNPDTGMSKWVMVINAPPGEVPLSVRPLSAVQKGVAVPLDSDPFSNMYVAGGAGMSPQDSPGYSSTSSWDVASQEQAEINAAIQFTKHTFVLVLNPTLFPSYGGSLDVAIANANFAALMAANPGWPPKMLLGSVFKKLLQMLGLYTGHSFKVCDVFANGDSACFVPNPVDNNILVQDGPAKDKDGHVLTDLTNRVAGGGGDGMVVINVPPNLEFGTPGSSRKSGEKWLICGYMGGGS